MNASPRRRRSVISLCRFLPWPKPRRCFEVDCRIAVPAPRLSHDPDNGDLSAGYRHFAFARWTDRHACTNGHPNPARAGSSRSVRRCGRGFRRKVVPRQTIDKDLRHSGGRCVDRPQALLRAIGRAADLQDRIVGGSPDRGGAGQLHPARGARTHAEPHGVAHVRK